jgi:hypothetical protein
VAAGSRPAAGHRATERRSTGHGDPGVVGVVSGEGRGTAWALEVGLLRVGDGVSGKAAKAGALHAASS